MADSIFSVNIKFGAAFNHTTVKPRLSLIAIAINVIAIAVYLSIARQSWWLVPELQQIPGASGGGAFIWFLTTCYTILIVGGLNLSIISLHLYSKYKKWSVRLDWSVILIIPLWILAIYVDYSHH